MKKLFLAAFICIAVSAYSQQVVPFRDTISNDQKKRSDNVVIPIPNKLRDTTILDSTYIGNGYVVTLDSLTYLTLLYMIDNVRPSQDARASQMFLILNNTYGNVTRKPLYDVKQKVIKQKH